MKIFLVIAMVVLALASSAMGSEYRLVPSISVAEEFTDNVFQDNANRHSDFITRLLPGIGGLYKGSNLELSTDYRLDYRYYARGSRETDITHDLQGKMTVSGLKDHFFLDVSEVYKRVSLDITKDVTVESLYRNQSDRNILTASPYLAFHPLDRGTLKGGYRYLNTWYKDPTAVSKYEHVGFIDGEYEFSPKFRVSTGYDYTHQVSDRGDYNQHDLYAGGRYEYGEKSFISFRSGNIWIAYLGGEHVSNAYWNASISHVIDRMTLGIASSLAYVEDPLRNLTRQTEVSGSADWALRRGNVGASVGYSTYRGTNGGTTASNKYWASLRGKLNITAKLSATAAVTGENHHTRTFDENNHARTVGSSPRRVVTDTTLAYELAKGLVVSLEHIYVSYRYEADPNESWYGNRTILWLSKTFE